MSKSSFHISRFIAKRIYSQKGSSFSNSTTYIAIGSIALGMAVMIVSFAIFKGFKERIMDKIFSLSAHIQVTKYDKSQSYEDIPISIQDPFYQNAHQVGGVSFIQAYSRKAALLKTDSEVAGVVIKGVDKDFNINFFQKNIVEGKFIQYGDTTASLDILVSRHLAKKMMLRLHDEVLIFFMQNPPRYRKMKICGIYDTGIEEFDAVILLADNRLLQQLNGWKADQTGGFEVFVKDFTRLDATFEAVFEALSYDMQAEKVTDTFRHFFDWFIMLNRNVLILMSIILSVASFNVISVLLIMITERTEMIGVLKSLGARDVQIQRIFFHHGIKILIKGLALGNCIGVLLCALQYYVPFIPLDPQNYYMDTVPIAWDWGMILFFNILTASIVAIVLMLPTYVIMRIRPAEAIRFH